MIKKTLPNSLKNFVKKILYKNNNLFSSNSQAREDVMLKYLFRKYIYQSYKGFYIDIGAFDPVKGSNTKIFYDYGWSGINIDANPSSIQKFNKHRKHDININIGISEHESIKPFYYFGSKDGINSFSESFITKNGQKNNVKKILKIETKTLSSILDFYLPSSMIIDFMDIDAEGLDFEVLKSNNWVKYRPKILLVELEARNFDNILNHEISKYLSKKNYEPFYRTFIGGSVGTVFFIDIKQKDDFFY